MNVIPRGDSLTGPTFAMPQPGDVVAGKYTIVRVLGEGGMGIVYEATHQRLRQRVALKMLLPSMLQHEVIVSRFEREARAAAQLRGRHCVRVMDVDITPDGLPYMVMDLLQGHDLQVEIERRGRLPVPEVADYVLMACAAMVEAHQLGIVHRDLKPSNLFLEREHGDRDQGSRATGGDAFVVKVLDFGISKVAATDDTDAKLTDADAMMGTALYMSPEQVKASHSVDARADVWALGVILYEALSGRVPWAGSTAQVAAMIVTEDPPDLRTLCDVPDELAAVVHKCLQRDPRSRFQDVKSLATALAPFAPPGSAGRSFAENIVAIGSYPRLPTGAQPPSSSSLAPPGRTDESARTLLNAPGVAEEMMRARETGTAPGWSQRPPSSSTGRAALIGVLVAFVVGLVVIGGVVLLLRRPHAAAPAPVVVTSEPRSTQVPSTQMPSSAAGPTEPSAPAIDPAPPTRVDVAPSPAPSQSAQPKAAAPARTTRPFAPASAKPGAPAPSAKPAANTPDKPLFL